MTGPEPRRGSIGEDGRNLAKKTQAAIGTFMLLIAFITFLTSKSLRHWVQGHSYLVFIVSTVFFSSTLMLASYVISLRAQRRELELSADGGSTVRARSPAAYALLRLLAFFDSAPVDIDLLRRPRNAPALSGELQRILTDPDYLRQAAIELSRMSLAEIDRSSRLIRPQRTAQIFARGQLSREEPETARAHESVVQSMLAASDPGTPDRDDTEGIYRRSRRHLFASGAFMSSDPEVRQLVINQLRRLYHAGGYIEGVALGEASLRHWRGTSGGDDRQTLALAVEVGSALRRSGRWQEAMKLNQETLEKLRSHFGTDDETYLLCARNHGTDLALLGGYSKALGNDLELLPAYDRVFGPRHLETLKLRNNVAISLRCLGRFEEALRYDQEIYAVRRRILGEEDMSTLTSRFAIARDLRMLGQVYQAHEILDDINLVLGGNLIISPYFRLLAEGDRAVSLRRCGYHAEALVQAETIFRQYNDMFGPDYRDTLRTGINVINDLRIAGRLLEARNLGERIVAGWTSVIGDDHPNTLAARATLACVFRAEGDLEASRHIDELVVAKFTEVFGETHPSTLAVMTNLASDFALLDETRQAREIGERSFLRHAETRGRNHPYTLATAENLSLDRRGTGDYAGAEELHAYALRTCEVKLGVGHPEARMIAQHRRMTLDIEPMMD